MERTAGKELALVRRGWGSPDPHVPGVPPPVQKLQASASFSNLSAKWMFLGVPIWEFRVPDPVKRLVWGMGTGI